MKNWPAPRHADRLPMKFQQRQSEIYDASPDECVFSRAYITLGLAKSLLGRLLPAEIARFPNEIGIHTTALVQLAYDARWTWSPDERRWRAP